MGCNSLDKELITFLNIAVEKQCLKLIDGKSSKNIHIFQMLREATDERGAQNNSGCAAKTGVQWRAKWKGLKSKYLEEKTASSKSGT